MPYSNFFAKNLLYLREHHNLKQADIQDKLGIMRNTWSNWENEKSEPSLENLFKIAQFFSVDVGNLLSENMGLNEGKDKATKDDGDDYSNVDEIGSEKSVCSYCSARNEMIEMQKQTIKALQGQVEALLMAIKLSVQPGDQ